MKKLRKYLLLFVLLSAHSILLFFLTINFQSVNYSFGKEDIVLTTMEMVKSIVRDQRTVENPDDYIFINTSYSKQFIPKVNSDGILIGQQIITSRDQLLQLLTNMEGSEHRYLLVDIFLDHETPENAAIEAALFQLKNKIIPYHIDESSQVLMPSITSNMGLSDIVTTNNAVGRYCIFDHDRKLIPLIMYEEIYEQNYTDYGLFGSLDGKLLTASFPLNLRIRNSDLLDNETTKDDDVYTLKKSWKYFELAEFLNIKNKVFLSNILKDKIVVVGDFENDKFHSHIGDIAGPLVILNAFLSLKHGDPFLSFSYVVFLLIAFGFLSYFLFKSFHVVEDGKKKIRVKVLLKPMSLFGIILLITLISYIFFDKYLSVFFLTLYVIVVDYLLRIVYYLIPKTRKLIEILNEE
jgi:hypothetical protein